MLHQAQHVPQERENLEINGSVFPLIDFKMVGYYDNTVFLRHALLRLSEKQFLQLNDILDNDVLQVRRVKKEEAPLSLKPKRFFCWSQHTENGTAYYKQMVTFCPLDWSSEPPPVVVLGIQQEALVDMVRAQAARFEALLDELTSRNILPAERAQQLLNETWEQLLQPERVKAIQRQLNKVNDAEHEMKETYKYKY